MRIVLVNPPHPSIGSRIPDEHLPPLGLLSIGGPLIDAGHEVSLVDADLDNLPVDETLRRVVALGPDAVLLGHSGSTSGHPIASRVMRGLRAALPAVRLVYGGVFPTYHWREVLSAEPAVDFIVRGEGEVTVVRLMAALEAGAVLDSVRGIAFRRDGAPFATPAAAAIQDLDSVRVGWELIDHARYSYWGNQRAVVVQLSRGCPHTCNYCGQRGFWTQFRYRDPKKLAAEIAHLHRVQGVRVFNLADENPTASRKVWREFLEALIAEEVRVTLVASTRAGDIVRDADILHLYKKAGVARFLLGMENTDEATLKLIRKGSTTAVDREAIRLLREHGIISLATWVVGFEDETLETYLRGLRQLITYDPDQIQVLYATPHRWTQFFRLAAHRRVIQKDASHWDYKHQVLETRHLRPWQVLLMVKAMEAVMQLRPRALARLFAHPDASFRDAMRWYYRIGRRVWPHEVKAFLFRERRVDDGPTVSELWGAPQEHEERPNVVERPRASRDAVAA
ncbi:MAG: magnesium-protoporphyrin IX monomethyl ester anaerobic oxidative cyclase [Myxococcaceae bacterium]